jgi:AcrR family transcriptional regulator
VATEKKKIEVKPATERGETTRARLLETAHILFLKKGFHGTSMRDIAEGAGLAVGGIYNHFCDKDEIFAAVLDAYHPYHTLAPAVLAVEADTLESYVRQVAHLIYDSLAGAEARVLPLLFIELVEFQGCHVRQLVGTLAPSMWDVMNRRLKGLRGRLRPLPMPLIFRAFLSLISGMVLSEMIVRELPAFKLAKSDWLDGVMDIFLHGAMEGK